MPPKTVKCDQEVLKAQTLARKDGTHAWGMLIHQRDENGNPTPLALALDAIAGNGCDCGVDEPGACLACRCELALKALWNALHFVIDVQEKCKVHGDGLPCRECMGLEILRLKGEIP